MVGASVELDGLGTTIDVSMTVTGAGGTRASDVGTGTYGAAGAEVVTTAIGEVEVAVVVVVEVVNIVKAGICTHWPRTSEQVWLAGQIP